MSLSPDTPSTSALDMRHAAMQPAPRVATSEQKSTLFNETMEATDFQRLLDTPSVDDSPNEPLLIESATATPLHTDEETLEIAIEASTWLTPQAVEITPSVELESVSAFSAQTTVSALDMTQNAVIDSALTLATNETVTVQMHTEAEALPLAITQAVENTPLISVPSTTYGAEILANSAIPTALHPMVFPLFSPSEPMTTYSSLPVPDVHHADFEKNIVTHLTWLADKSIGQAYIHVTPAHLGPVEIKLNLLNQHLHAVFFSPHSEVCQRLQESLPALQRLLDEHGLHLAQADVQQQAADSDTPPDTANIPELSAAAQQNGTRSEEETTPWQSEHYSHTTLLDTWA